MSRFNYPIFSFLVLFSVLFFNCKKNTVSTKDTTFAKADSILSLMTLDEKIGQLNQLSGYEELTGNIANEDGQLSRTEMIKKGMIGSFLNVIGAEKTYQVQKLAVEESRLGIPLIFGYDVVHGFQTMFPVPLAMAASWDAEVVKSASSVAATETAAAGVHWTFAPMVDVSRDARWGRAMEGFGEDTYLTSKMAYAAVKGFQGDDLSSRTTIASCAKHFAAYGFIESGREYNSVSIDDATLHDVVFPPFKACVDAGIATFMNAFNTVNGVPATGSAFLQRDILKGEWNFDGFVLSDWASIGEIVTHGAAKDKKEAAKIAIKAGCDMDMQSISYSNHLKELVNEGLVEEALIDDAVRRILNVKLQLGLFDDPYKYCNVDFEKQVIGSQDHKNVARDAARKSIVLLKNTDNILPLSKTSKIAVIGPFGNDTDSPLGSWRAQAKTNSAVSIYEGIKNKSINPEDVSFAKGCDLTVDGTHFIYHLKFNTKDKSGFGKAVKTASKADVVLLAIGENAFESGEGRSKTDIKLKGLQEELLDEILKVNKNVVVLLSNGRAMDISELSKKVPGLLVTWQLGSESGNAIADVVFGDYNPSAKLPISFPRNIGQVPVYYNTLSTGRPVQEGGNVFYSHYTDSEKTPLYPFGYGLSYTSFEYSDLKVSTQGKGADVKITVSCTVSNTGNLDGEEVVQLYINDPVASRSRPVKELKGFKKVLIAKGASETIQFELSAQDLAFWTLNNKKEMEPGLFHVYVGPNSQTGLTDTFEVSK
ncbi:beta-glucosidase BglX [Tenacibaculum tangerinum]|uniref:Beta-glucosidase BglX n=1 Tax=Tenacibaculum tangerinum TaxID=3038772 RepID=A0ABY8L1C4_9FLAO|nr:beta-glucosidase BglX [Tenacibaculum tangerinum]WGH75262.1 beta-glucosidase BglX [Tenacibaculum tangerinum]